MQRCHAHAEKADLVIAAHTALLIDVEVKALVQAATRQIRKPSPDRCTR